MNSELLASRKWNYGCFIYVIISKARIAYSQISGIKHKPNQHPYIMLLDSSLVEDFGKASLILQVKLN